ncbi:MAG: universal stress protein [Phormidesmis sp.]
MVFVPFKTILVAIDDAEVSLKALTVAKNLAQTLEAELMIAHVLDSHDSRRPRLPYTYSTPDAIYLDEEIRQKYDREWTNYVSYYESLLKQEADEAIAAGIDADFLLPQGPAGSTLCEIARTSNVSLMVVGSHQRRGIAESLLGSTSNYITHHAPCSVLVVYAHGQVEEFSTKSEERGRAQDISMAKPSRGIA